MTGPRRDLGQGLLGKGNNNAKAVPRAATLGLQSWPLNLAEPSFVSSPISGNQERALGLCPAGGVSPGAQDGVVTLGGVKRRRGGLIPAGWGVRVGAGLVLPVQPQPGLKGQTDNESFPLLAPEREGFPDRKLTSSNPPSSDPSSQQSWPK